MRLDIDISTDESDAPDAALVQKVAEQAIVRGVKNIDVSTVFAVDIVFVSEVKIRAINKEYRGKDAVTDVLSFGDYTDSPAGVLTKEGVSLEIFTESATDSPVPRASQTVSLSPTSDESVVLGQLFLCYDYIVKAAEEDGVSLEREMAYILSHGVLHLLGYDHTEEMFAIQDCISESF
jgi:probable rRNA maturation factor